MPVIYHADVPVEQFPGGAGYQTVIGDSEGTTPIRLGLQTCPPGYKTALHSHPYLEAITVLEGVGEAWLEGNEGVVTLKPGMTLALPPNVRHQFRALGSEPFKIMGIHASPHRIVIVDKSGHGGLRD
jgi:quercetin dioxygenase-like cupin family protein